MSSEPNKTQLSAEERKKNREKYMIKDKENETIYRHYGDLNGADFKLRNNKNCEIYILDWSKGMYIDDCFDCKIYCGPIDGSIFIRGSKNCQISIIARQVRFRNCENLKVFTYCPSDPAVESSFNIYFAPFNAFFPHLKELFVKGEFKKDEKNHIDTPYDFTPSEELGGGAPHFLQLPEEEFFIKTINDGDKPVEEMYDGYSEQELWVKNKASEIPSFEKKENINDDFNFLSENENKNNEPNVQPTLNDIINPTNNENEPKVNINNNNDNNIMNMDDFLLDNMDLSNKNKPDINTDFNTNNNNNNNNNNDFNFNTNTNSNNNNNDFMDMNDFLGGNNKDKNVSSQPKTNIDFDNFNFDNTKNNNNDNNFNTSNNFNNFFDNNNSQKGNINSFNYNMPNNISKEENEELRRQELRNKEKEIRQQRIREKMEKEAKMRMEIMAKASQYINQFYEERKKRIALNHEKLLNSTGNQNNSSSGSPWGMVESSFTGSTSNADRMKEAILNRNREQKK